MKVLNFLSLEKILARLKRKIIFALMCFVTKNNLEYIVYVLDQKFKNCMDLLLIKDGNMSISNIFTDLCVKRQNARLKNTFANIVYNVLVVREFW